MITLVDVVNKNGARLLNVGPRPDGTIPDTKPAAFTSEDIRFTHKENHLYAYVMQWPADGTVRIRSLGAGAVHPLSHIESVELLGPGRVLTWKPEPDALHVSVEGPPPARAPLGLRIRSAG